MHIETRHAVVAALAIALTGAFASSASAATCDPALYPTPFLHFYGGIYNANTRFIELHVPSRNSQAQAWSDPVYPFTVTVAPSNRAAKSFTVKNYAKQQFPAKFTSRTQTTHLTATYDEIHTSYPVVGGTGVNTTCTRTISATFKAPPKPRSTRRGSSGGGGRHGGEREDTDDR